MSRTYRKSSLDNASGVWWINYYPKYFSKRNRDGFSRNKARELTKWHTTWERRSNDKIVINDFNRGIDPDEIEYKDDRNLRYVLWNYD